MTNKQIIAANNRVTKLIAEEKELRKQYKKLEKRFDTIQDILHDVNKIDEIYEGVALTVGDVDSNWCDFRGVGDDYNRGARFYLNAHNETTWGIQFWDWDKRLGEQGREIWGGSRWPTKNEAIIACKRWILYRELQERY